MSRCHFAGLTVSYGQVWTYIYIYLIYVIYVIYDNSITSYSLLFKFFGREPIVSIDLILQDITNFYEQRKKPPLKNISDTKLRRHTKLLK